MEYKLKFFVPGNPKPAGSKTAGWASRKQKLYVRDSSGPAGKSWRETVGWYAHQAMVDARVQRIEGAVCVKFIFYLARPKAHYRTGKYSSLLRADAPTDHLQVPDLLKLSRAVEDAMTGIVYADDRLIINENLSKRWHGGTVINRAPKPGVAIEIGWR